MLDHGPRAAGESLQEENPLGAADLVQRLSPDSPVAAQAAAIAKEFGLDLSNESHPLTSPRGPRGPFSPLVLETMP